MLRSDRVTILTLKQSIKYYEDVSVFFYSNAACKLQFFLSGVILSSVPCMAVPYFRVFTKLWKANTNFVMYGGTPLHLYTWNNSAPTGWIFMKFILECIYKPTRCTKFL